ncbi:hypothetical protein B0H14DRAFT_3127394 [Mycena olivaceomarginata]|nr:hypothetical protein B0H14DRAFT_3127394 [Mycena olivaceomarginata]
MVLLTTPRLTAHQRLDNLRAEQPALDAIFNDGLDNTHHFKMLAQPTLENHDRVMEKWRSFVSYNPRGYPDLPTELEVGIPDIPEGAIKAFIAFLAGSIEGRLDVHCTRGTVMNHLYTFFACMGRHAKLFVPIATRRQLSAFVNSPDLDSISPLSTKIRPKPIADAHDLDAIIRFVWNDTKIFPTNRGKIQFNLVNLIASLTSQRPGSIIESVKYKGSNECLQWQDVEFVVVPNPKDPAHPNVVVGLRFRFTKGQRNKEKYFQKYYILFEPAGHRAACCGTMLLALAIEDGALQDVTDVEDVLSPQTPPNRPHTLQIADKSCSQPICRSEVVENGVYIISATDALQGAVHNARLTTVVFYFGGKINLTMYGWRRAAGNRFNVLLSESDREALMGHRGGSHMFANSYQTRSYTHDFGGMLHGRERDPAGEALAYSATTLSVDRDPDAPTCLDLFEMAALNAEPELISMRTQRLQLRADAKSFILQLKTLDPDDPELDDARTDLHAQLRSTIVELKKSCAVYSALRGREMSARLKVKRAAWFKDGSRRQLSGEAQAAPRTPLVDKTVSRPVPFVHRIVTSEGKENGKSATNQPAFNMSPINPQDALFEVLYHSSEPCLADDITAAVNMFSGLPARRFAHCYPGEHPTTDEKCPVCGTDCRRGALGSKSIGGHIHNCILNQRRQTVQEQMDAQYVPRPCSWDDCPDADDDTYFATRAEFVAHLQRHIKKADKTGCKWKVDEKCCGDDEPQDWFTHFARCHDINAKTLVEVRYCVVCPVWHVDERGDNLTWELHLHEHFDSLFSRFSIRPDDNDIDLTPLGIQFTPPVDNGVEYQNGSGFDGELPEFHGEIVDGIPVTPMYCPWHVFDETADIEDRMRQWIRNDHYLKHLQTHKIDLTETDNLCPVPSCGTRRFTQLDLESHMVAFHRVPLYSSTRQTRIRCLNLPPPPQPASEPSVIDLAHLNDDLMHIDPPQPAEHIAKAGPAPRLMVAMEAAKARREKAAEAQTAVEGWCYGCSRRSADIGRHINNTNCRSKNSYCLMIDGAKVGGKLSWDLTDPTPSVRSKGQNKLETPHFCTSCRRQCANILEHVDVCEYLSRPTHFQIFAAGTKKSERKKAPRISIEDWRKQQGGLPSQPAASSSRLGAVASGGLPSQPAASSSRLGAVASGGLPSQPAASSSRLGAVASGGPPSQPASAPAASMLAKRVRRPPSPDNLSDADLEEGMSEPPAKMIRLHDAQPADKSKQVRPQQYAIRLDRLPDPTTLPPYMCVACSEELTADGMAIHFSGLRANSRCGARKYRTRNRDARPGYKWSGTVEIYTDSLESFGNTL